MESTRITHFLVSLCAAVLVSGALAGAPTAFAAQGDCSQPVTNGTTPTASDCLFILRAAVGSETCNPLCICDTTGAGGATASDALLCLKVAVGQTGVTLNCSCPVDTTSTTSSTTVTTSSTTTTSTVPDTTTTTDGGTTTTIETTTTTNGVTTTTDGGTTTTTIDGGTTTTAPDTTTTVPTTTTTIGSLECPTSADLTIFAGTGDECANNGDCIVGTCDDGLGRCVTRTELDTGWTGIAHDSDLTDAVVVKAGLSSCDGTGPTCGLCEVANLDPAPGYCRCANDNQVICDEPFANDDNDCGGEACQCYIGPPLALSAGNTPACVVNRISEDVTGTVDVDTGDASTTIKLRSVVFLGEFLHQPCPFCDGDITENDGVRDGTCVLGPNEGDDCDSNGFNQSFPAPGGNGHSLDCFPDVGKNVSGAGLIIDITQTTGTDSITAGVLCGLPPTISLACHCGTCSVNTGIACTANQDCVDAGAGPECKRRGAFDPAPHQCNTACEDTGDGLNGLCDDDGPEDNGCDGILKANGDFFVQCSSNADCDPINIGIDAGDCTLNKRRGCFLPTITAIGDPDPVTPVGAGVFCIPPTASPAINTVAGLPGPARVLNQGAVEFQCTGGAYVAGAGCP